MKGLLQPPALLMVLVVLVSAFGLSFPAAHAQKDMDKGKAAATAVFERC
jgi:hypothetical protein